MAQKTEQSLAERLIAGDKRALARAITLIENDDPRAGSWSARSSRAPAAPGSSG